MVRLTVVNITGILSLYNIKAPLKRWSTSSEKGGQHHRNRWSRWIGIYTNDVASIHTTSKIDLTISEYQNFHSELFLKAMEKKGLNPIEYKLS